MIEITIRLEQSPDIVDKIGQITHVGLVAGGTVMTRSLTLPHPVPRETPPEAQPGVGNLTPGVNLSDDGSWDAANPQQPLEDESVPPAQGARAPQQRRRR